MVGGDGLCLSIAAASIVAKVVRDRAMARLAVRFPGYGWHANAGYATAFHREALRSTRADPSSSRGLRDRCATAAGADDCRLTWLRAAVTIRP